MESCSTDSSVPQAPNWPSVQEAWTVLGEFGSLFPAQWISEEPVSQEVPAIVHAGVL